MWLEALEKETLSSSLLVACKEIPYILYSQAAYYYLLASFYINRSISNNSFVEHLKGRILSRY